MGIFCRYMINNIINPFYSEYGGSHMSTHVLLNLLNELRKRDKMLSILSLFCNEFNKKCHSYCFLKNL